MSSDYTRVIAFDPGGTTGYATLELTSGEEPKITVGHISENHHHSELYDLIYVNQPDVIVTERFDYRRKQQHAVLVSVEYIGVMRLYSQLHDVELKQQQQMKGKFGLWTDDKIKAIGLYVPGSDHAMDALRQLLYYATVEMEEHYFIEMYRERTNE